MQADGHLVDHSGLFDVGENLDFSAGEDWQPNYDPFVAWYDDEKESL